MFHWRNIRRAGANARWAGNPGDSRQKEDLAFICPESRLITGHKYPDQGAYPLTRAPGPVTSRGLRQRLRLCDICQHAQTGGGSLSAFFGEMVEEEIVMLTAFMEIDRRQHG